MSLGLVDLQFRVAGHPTTQGSKRAFVVNGRPVLVEAKGDTLRLWRHAVSDAARLARGDADMLIGPVKVVLRFDLVKPASAPKRTRTWPIKARSGDVDKLARAVLDALTGVLFYDDAQVVYLAVAKDWCRSDTGPGLLIAVSEVI